MHKTKIKFKSKLPKRKAKELGQTPEIINDVEKALPNDANETVKSLGQFVHENREKIVTNLNNHDSITIEVGHDESENNADRNRESHKMAEQKSKSKKKRGNQKDILVEDKKDNKDSKEDLKNQYHVEDENTAHKRRNKKYSKQRQPEKQGKRDWNENIPGITLEAKSENIDEIVQHNIVTPSDSVLVYDNVQVEVSNNLNSQYLRNQEKHQGKNKLNPIHKRIQKEYEKIKKSQKPVLKGKENEADIDIKWKEILRKFSEGNYCFSDIDEFMKKK